MRASAILKVILIPFLLICLLEMPYGYYQFVRFVAMGVFAFLAFDSFKNEKQELGILFGALALLFQPFIKIALGRELWNIVDVVVTVLLVVLVVNERRIKPN